MSLGALMSGAGGGSLETYIGTDPAAGAEISEAVPNDEVWHIEILRAELVTDSNVADRTVNVTISSSGGTELFRQNFSTKQANTTFQIEMAEFGFDPPDVDTRARAALPINLRIPPGAVIATETTNLQAGDDYSAPTMLVERLDVITHTV